MLLLSDLSGIVYEIHICLQDKNKVRNAKR